MLLFYKHFIELHKVIKNQLDKSEHAYLTTKQINKLNFT